MEVRVKNILFHNTNWVCIASIVTARCLHKHCVVRNKAKVNEVHLAEMRWNYVQTKTKSIDTGADGGNPHKRFLWHDPARKHQIFFRPLHHRGFLPLGMGDPGVPAVHGGTGNPFPACGPQRGNAKEGQCWPAVPTIAREIKLSEATVRRAIRDLRKAGLVETEQRYRTKGGKSSLLFRMKDR